MLIWVLPPVAVRRLGIRDPPHVLGRPGWPGPPAGNWDTIPLTQLSSENPLSFPKTGGLKARSALVTFRTVQIRTAARWRGRACGMSKFTPSIIWREALDTTAERKSAAIVPPCPNSHKPPPLKHDASHRRGSAVSFLGPPGSLQPNQFGFRNIPALAAPANNVIVSNWEQRSDHSSKT